MIKLAMRDNNLGTKTPSKSPVLRLGLLVLTNFMASMTVSTLALLSLTMVYLPAIGEALIAFVLFPLNAFLNPIINTLTIDSYIKEHPYKEYAYMYVRNAIHTIYNMFLHLVNRYKCCTLKLPRVSKISKNNTKVKDNTN